MIRHFVSSDDLTPDEQGALLRRAFDLKRMRRTHGKPLEGRSVGMFFEKPSTRTRVSFEAAIFELGGNPIFLRGDELQLGRGETLQDTARVFSRYLDCLVIRTFGQDRLDSLAETSEIPVVNALSDLEHPCQALADVMTVNENYGDLSSVKIVYVGDGNNVCHSLLLACAKAGVGYVEAACPVGFEPIEPIVEQASMIGAETGSRVVVSNDPFEAAYEANVVYTDVWASMGQEAEHEKRIIAFKGFQVNAELLSKAAPDVIVLHCLPAHRGEEITDEVIDGAHSRVWDQAENRLHAQKALLEWLVKERK